MGTLDDDPGFATPAALTAEHDLSGFDCGEPALNDWLRHRALKNESRFSRTYVVCRGREVIGYYCLSAGAVERGDAPGRVRRNAPDAIPVSILGRLAVDRAHAGKGLGAELLADALFRIAAAAQSIGIAVMMVQAKDDAARRFYLACAEFIEYPDDSRTLYLPIETVVGSLRYPSPPPRARHSQ